MCEMTNRPLPTQVFSDTRQYGACKYLRSPVLQHFLHRKPFPAAALSSSSLLKAAKHALMSTGCCGFSEGSDPAAGAAVTGLAAAVSPVAAAAVAAVAAVTAVAEGTATGKGGCSLLRVSQL